MRSSIRPPRLRTDSHASSAEKTFPRCILPLGLGAKRPVSIVVSFLS